MFKLFSILLLSMFTLTAHAEIQTREIVYQVDGNDFTGYLAFDDTLTQEHPGILIVHEWWGHNSYARKRAEMLAALGYTAFALDMYGSGNVADHPDDAKALMMAATSDIGVTHQRFQAGLNVLLEQPGVDAKKIAVIGYCMGGGIALNMARAGADVAAVVTFHGSLGTTAPAKPGEIKARIMVFTGADDPFVPPAQVDAFEQEMKAAGADYALKRYPGAKHSFTNPDADSFAARFGMPLAYNKAADEDSWQAMQKFLRHTFNPGR
ncbi:dienelactone hydrolase family protein [Mariprofundus erugo]|uniref:Dienelactone hydrolase family protein n=1 Tax=Mariprofundus erugo TaxID=2528639 RepID=A0A5R9GS22_9PROT|nr:dienelactone hydrolase family protein [Mariprofundus erugo]TLS67233.1 dienelactone hydrolase family protein [Mariprofundus erugo]